MNKTMKMAFGIIVAIILVGVFLAWRIESAKRNDPLYTLKLVDQIKTMADLELKREYFTPKGYELQKWMMSQNGDQDSSSPTLAYSAPQFNGDGGCDVFIIDDRVKMLLHLVKGKYWQFDDVCIVGLDGLSIDVWMSDYKDHPVSTAIGGGVNYMSDLIEELIEMYAAHLFGL